MIVGFIGGANRDLMVYGGIICTWVPASLPICKPAWYVITFLVGAIIMLYGASLDE